MERSFVLADATIADLRKQAAGCEDQATKESEPLATELREKAKLLKAWVAELVSGKWKSIQR